MDEIFLSQLKATWKLHYRFVDEIEIFKSNSAYIVTLMTEFVVSRLLYFYTNQFVS